MAVAGSRCMLTRQLASAGGAVHAEDLSVGPREESVQSSWGLPSPAMCCTSLHVQGCQKVDVQLCSLLRAIRCS